MLPVLLTALQGSCTVTIGQLMVPLYYNRGSWLTSLL